MLLYKKETDEISGFLGYLLISGTLFVRLKLVKGHNMSNKEKLSHFNEKEGRRLRKKTVLLFLLPPPHCFHCDASPEL